MAGKTKSDQFRDAAKKAKTVGDLKKQYAKEGAKRIASKVVSRLGPVGAAAALAYENRDKIMKGMKDMAAKSNKDEADVSNFKNGGKVMNKPMAYKKGGKVFKPCAGCPSPAKCMKAGKCLAKAAPKKKMKSGGRVSKKK